MLYEVITPVAGCAGRRLVKRRALGATGGNRIVVDAREVGGKVLDLLVGEAHRLAPLALGPGRRMA